jgi:uncharacterized protein (TIGR02246 family)
VAASPALAAEVAEHRFSVSDKERIQRAYRAFNQAFGDAAAVAALYAKDAVLLPPTHDIIKGRKAIRDFWKPLFDAGLHGHTLDLITFRSDLRTVVTAAKWSAQGRDAKGRPVTFSGTATIVFARRKDFGLDIWVHTWN